MDQKQKRNILIPWTALLLLSVIAMRLWNMNLVLGSVPSIGILIASILVMVLEFLRSGDIQLGKFITDTTISTISLIIASWYIAYMVIERKPLHFVEYLVYVIIILDSWLSPINAFRTALRNVQLQSGDN
jgi:hypothetical protein